MSATDARAPHARLLLALLVGACGPSHHESLERRGTVIRLVAEHERAALPGGVVATPGDYVIEAEGLRVVVAGLRRGDDVAGSIVEATLVGATPDDSVVGVAPVLHTGQRAYPVHAREMYVIEQAGRPVLRTHGTVSLGERAVDVVEDMSVVSFGAGLTIRTRVEADDGEALGQVRIARRVQWGGGVPFVPGVGQVQDDAWHEANWIGREGRSMSTLIGYRSPPLRSRALFERHGATSFLSYTDVASPRHDVAAGEALEERTWLLLASGALGDAVRRLGWARGAPFPEVLVSVPDSPEGVRIQVHTAARRLLLSMRVDRRGQALVPLFAARSAEPSTRHFVSAVAPGYAPSEEVSLADLERRRVLLAIPRGGRILVRVTDAETARSIAARVRVHAFGDTEELVLGPESSAAGAIDTVVTLAGTVEIPAPPGTYHVIVTHGPEWTLLSETVEVTETLRPEVRASLAHVVRPGPWVASDFHLHAAPSTDSQVPLADRVAALVAEGIRFAVPTDHNHVTDYGPTIVELGATDLGTVTGVEVTTWDPAYGHFNAYPHPLDATRPGGGAPAYKHTSPGELFAALHAVDPEVVVQVNHPRMEHGIGYFDVMGLESDTGSADDAFSSDFDLLEVWNGFDLNRMEMFDRVFADWLALLERGQRITAVGSSDSHTVHLQWAGYPRTYVRVPGGDFSDPMAVVRSVRAGHAFVTSGPFLDVTVQGHGPGETVTTPPGVVRIHVRVSAPPWMDVSRVEVYSGRTVIRSIPIAPSTGPERASLDVDVEVIEPGFLVVVARGDRPMDDLLARPGIPPLAFTNPIWLELAPSGSIDAGRPEAGPHAPAQPER